MECEVEYTDDFENWWDIKALSKEGKVAMAKPFKNLKQKLSPATLARAEKRAKKMLTNSK